MVEFAGEPKEAHLVIQSAAMQIFFPVSFFSPQCPSMVKNDDDSVSVFELYAMIYGEVAEQGA